MNKIYPNLSTAITRAAWELGECGVPVACKSWHAQKCPAPMIELLNHSFIAVVPNTLDELQHQCLPNNPWADEHFQERVSGIPSNPPPSHVRWPFAVNENKMHKGEAFSHSYPERIWCQNIEPAPGALRRKPDGIRYDAGDLSTLIEVFQNIEPAPGALRGKPDGIRYDAGDLSTLIEVLLDDALTRQAYLPIWFPEDLTAAQWRHRVPCTLGYHFIRRDKWLHMVYPMRSCDFLRHFRDDVYLACRLLHWVLHECQKRYNGDEQLSWDCVIPGTLKMDITSLHVFEHERSVVKIQGAA